MEINAKQMKVLKFLENKDLSTIENFIELDEKVDTLNKKIDNGLASISEELKKKLEEELDYQIDPDEIRGAKGDDGYTPIKEIDYFDGKPGANYILTLEDKQEIASYIEVPIVEKIIERIETKETPIVTENVIYEAVTDDPEVIADKLNTLTEAVNPDVIKGYKEFERVTRENLFNPTMGPSFADLENINKRINNLPVSGGANPAGTGFELQYRLDATHFGAIPNSIGNGTDSLGNPFDEKFFKNLGVSTVPSSPTTLMEGNAPDISYDFPTTISYRIYSYSDFGGMNVPSSSFLDAGTISGVGLAGGGVSGSFTADPNPDVTGYFLFKNVNGVGFTQYGDLGTGTSWSDGLDSNNNPVSSIEDSNITTYVNYLIGGVLYGIYTDGSAMVQGILNVKTGGASGQLGTFANFGDTSYMVNIQNELVVVGSTDTSSDFQNLAHFDAQSQSARSSFIVSNSGDGNWTENFMNIFVHGSTFPGKYYPSSIGASTNAGAAFLLAQSNSNVLTEFGIGVNNNVPVYIFAGSGDDSDVITTFNYDSAFGTKFAYNIYLQSGLLDGSASLGTSGNILSSTGSATAWIPNPALISPMTTLGDIIYENATPTAARLAGNTTATKKFLTQTGTGSASAAPGWNTIVAADVPGSALTKTDDTNVTLTLGGTPSTALLAATSITAGWTGTLSVARGGTGASTLTGAGIPTMTSADLTAQTAAVTSVTTVTAPNDSAMHTYQVGAYINVNSVSVDVIQVQVAYTDENSTAQTQTFSSIGSSPAISFSTIGDFNLSTFNIRAKFNTSITIKTVLTTGIGSINYDCGGSIMRIN